ncbi:MAG: calcium/sodium antiporter [Gammaproteobacteria bacterium]
MLHAIAAVILGFVLLLWGADRFVTGAAALARNLGVSPLIIGLTIVGFGTSAPEMLVSAVASWQGNTGLAVGNAIGSNITNVALILGLTALITPLSVRSETLRREFPLLFVAMLGTLVLLLNGRLDRWNGIILLTAMGVILYWMFALAMRGRRDPMLAEYEAEIPAGMANARAGVWLAVGLTLLLASSKMLVWGAVSIAHTLGISDLVIGLTVVAIGTSLPELAASVMSAVKGEHDIAIGNVLGSNIFNLLVVLGLPGVIRPGPIPPEALERDFPVMIGLTVLLFAMAYGFRRPGHVTRLEGVILLAAFVGYEVLLYMTARQ